MTNPRAESATHENISEKFAKMMLCNLSGGSSAVPARSLKRRPSSKCRGCMYPGHCRPTARERGSSGTSLWNGAALVPCAWLISLSTTSSGFPRVADSSLCGRSTVPACLEPPVEGASALGPSSTHSPVWCELSSLLTKPLTFS